MYKLIKTKEKLFTQKEVDKLIGDAILKYFKRVMDSCSPASIDFKKMNVFSVERCWTNDYNTIIGYFDRENEVKEWHLRISDEDYLKLLEEFNKTKA